MTRVHSKDTQPEMRVRRLVHSLGYRYRRTAKTCREIRPGVSKRRKIILFTAASGMGTTARPAASDKGE